VSRRFHEISSIASAENGQTMTDYALVVGVVSIAAVVTLGAIGEIASGMFGGVLDVLRGLIP